MSKKVEDMTNKKERSFNIQVYELGIDVILEECDIDPDGEMGDRTVQEYVHACITNCGSVKRWAEDWNLLDDASIGDVVVTEVGKK